MKDWRSIADIRREYGHLQLTDGTVEENPLLQFKLWFEEVLNSEKSDPTAMVLSTVDASGRPDSRVVLLKSLEEDVFVFFTNYDSTKSLQINGTPYAALNFYWPQMARQVRIRGPVKRVSDKLSDEYFAKRPLESQLSAIVSRQSQPIKDRETLEISYRQLLEKSQNQPVTRPENWGGFCVIPEEMEFWQGRDNRLHDRFHFVLKNGQWISQRLAP